MSDKAIEGAIDRRSANGVPLLLQGFNHRLCTEVLSLGKAIKDRQHEQSLLGGNQISASQPSVESFETGRRQRL
jgi:hypothetical protein